MSQLQVFSAIPSVFQPENVGVKNGHCGRTNSLQITPAGSGHNSITVTSARVLRCSQTVGQDVHGAPQSITTAPRTRGTARLLQGLLSL